MVKTTLGLPVAFSQTLSTSARGTTLVAICRFAGSTASKMLRIDCTSADRLTLPMPLPMSVIGAERRAAPERSMLGSPLELPTWTKRTGLSSIVLARADNGDLCTLAPEVVDHDINTFGERLLESLFVIARARWVVRAKCEWNDGVCAELLHLFEFPRIAGSGNDSGSAEMLRQLYGDPTGGARRSIDHHGFSADEVPTLNQSRPCRHAWIRNGGCGNVVQRVRDVYAAAGVDRTELGKRA